MKWSILPARLHGVLEAARVLAFLLGLCGTTFAAAPAGAPDSQKAKTLFQNKMRDLSRSQWCRNSARKANQRTRFAFRRGPGAVEC
jgi:hypothetical protein